MIARVVLGIAFLLCVALAFSATYRGRYENTSLVILWCSMSMISAIALFANEIVSAIKGQGDRDATPNVADARRQAASSAVLKRTPGWTKRDNSPEPAPIGQLPGETVEQWAKRVETEEAAAFKAKSRGPS